MVTDMQHLKSLTVRVRAEYREMPDLSLTIEQACRLWGMRRPVCEHVLKELVVVGTLYHTPGGAYVAAAPIRQRG